jgi:hypothetical protein
MEVLKMEQSRTQIYNHAPKKLKAVNIYIRKIIKIIIILYL